MTAHAGDRLPECLELRPSCEERLFG